MVEFVLKSIKGALDNFSLIPHFLFIYLSIFIKVEIFIPLEVYSDCMLNLTCNFNLFTKICEFFLQGPFLKVFF